MLRKVFSMAYFLYHGFDSRICFGTVKRIKKKKDCLQSLFHEATDLKRFHEIAQSSFDELNRLIQVLAEFKFKTEEDASLSPVIVT